MKKLKRILFISFILISTLTLSACQEIDNLTGNEGRFVESWKGYLNRNPIYVNIDHKFENSLKENIVEAVNILDNNSKGITFKINHTDYSENRYINIIKDINEEYTSYESGVAGRAITTTSKNSFGDRFVTSYELRSNIYLLKGFYRYGTVENIVIHEMMHSLGFGHSDDPESIMYHIAGNNSMTKEDIDMINEKYPGE